MALFLCRTRRRCACWSITQFYLVKFNSSACVCKFHGCASWFHFWDGWSAAHFTSRWLLFICLCSPEFACLRRGALQNSSNDFIAHRRAVYSSFSVYFGSTLVFCCGGDTLQTLILTFYCRYILLFVMHLLIALTNYPFYMHTSCNLCNIYSWAMSHIFLTDCYSLTSRLG